MKKSFSLGVPEILLLVSCVCITAANEAPAHGAPAAAGAAATPTTKGAGGNVSISHTTNITGAGLGCSEYLWQSFVASLPVQAAHGSANGSAKSNSSKTETTVVNTTKVESKSQDANVNKTEMHAVTMTSTNSDKAPGPPGTSGGHGDEHGATTKRSDAHGGIQEAFGNNPEKTAAGSAASNWTAPSFSFKTSNCSDKTDKWEIDMKLWANLTSEQHLPPAALQNYFSATMTNFNKAFAAAFNTTSKSLEGAMSSANQRFKTAGTSAGGGHNATASGNVTTTSSHNGTKTASSAAGDASHH